MKSQRGEKGGNFDFLNFFAALSFALIIISITITPIITIYCRLIRILTIVQSIRLTHHWKAHLTYYVLLQWQMLPTLSTGKIGTTSHACSPKWYPYFSSGQTTTTTTAFISTFHRTKIHVILTIRYLVRVLIYACVRS